MVIVANTMMICSCSNNEKRFEKYYEKNGCKNLVLKIYYVVPSTLTNMALSVDDLVNGSDQFVTYVFVDSDELNNHKELVEKLAKTDNVELKKEKNINARVYYLFETKDGKKLFDCCLWGGKNFIVNGKCVEDNDIYIEAILPYVSGETFEQLSNTLKK